MMMYGFGDAAVPVQATVDLVEDTLVEYIRDVVFKAMDNSLQHGKIALEDILHLVRKDNRKFHRVRELLYMNEELKKARKGLEDGDVKDLVEDVA